MLLTMLMFSVGLHIGTDWIKARRIEDSREAHMILIRTKSQELDPVHAKSRSHSHALRDAFMSITERQIA